MKNKIAGYFALILSVVILVACQPKKEPNYPEFVVLGQPVSTAEAVPTAAAEISTIQIEEIPDFNDSVVGDQSALSVYVGGYDEAYQKAFQSVDVKVVPQKGMGISTSYSWQTQEIGSSDTTDLYDEETVVEINGLKFYVLNLERGSGWVKLYLTTNPQTVSQ